MLVLGAGIAGLTAARDLRAHGLRDPGQVIVLEATDRVGGRIRTDRSTGSPLELGASWIHGVRNNPVTGLADELELRRAHTDYDSLLVGAGGGQPLTGMVPAQEELDRSLSAVRKRRRGLARDESMAAALEAVGAGTGITAQQQQALDWLYFWDIESEYAGPLDRLSVLRWDRDAAFGGGDDVLRDGYDAIVNHVATGLDVRLSTPARSIRTTAGGVEVETDSGVLAADGVVVALPLGVLQAGGIAFEPGLPAKVQTAIDRLGFGAGLKLALRFPTVSWSPSTHFFAHAAGSDSLIFSNLAVHDGSPTLLMEAYLDKARRLEQAPIEEAAQVALTALRDLVGPLPEPEAVTRSGWNASPWAGGAYSYWGIGLTRSQIGKLGKPVGRRMIFAGEHTSARYPGTVHGALLSGLDAARRLLGKLD